MMLLEPTIGNILGVVWRHRFIVVLSALAIIGLTVVAYLAATPSFESTTTLIVGQNNGAGSSPDAAMPSELMNAQIRIAESNDVLRAAIERVGEDKFGIGKDGALKGLGGKLRQWWHGTKVPENQPQRLSKLDLVAIMLRSAVSVRSEPNSNVMTISFRHSDPVFAADFANALAQSFIERQNSLLGRPGIIAFFQEQTKRFTDEVATRSAALEDFMRKSNAYSVDEQRSLLLKRASDIQAAIGGTRSSLADKEGQKSALSRQLRILEPVTHSPFVLGFVQRLSAPDDLETGTRQGGKSGEAPLKVGDAPPILMIKVFQDAMAAFRLVDADILGLRDLLTQQMKEAELVGQELSRITAAQSEYERLKRDLALATFNAETFAKRTVEEQIESDLRDAKLSNVHVIQPAIMPLKAAFPNGMAFLAFGCAFGLAIGIALALLKEMIDLNRRKPSSRASSGVQGTLSAATSH